MRTSRLSWRPEHFTGPTSMTQPAPSSPEPQLQRAGVRAAQVLVACRELAPTLNYLLQQLDFHVDAIFPADNPSTAMVSGHGLSLRLVQGAMSGATDIYLLCDDPAAAGASVLTAPNGLRIHLVAADPPMRQPATQQSLVLTRGAGAEAWGVGRAGMCYRDLVPDRLGGAFIASHIRILEGGPVGDYVHFHKIRFQTIFCRKGWVRVAYEGQGEPLVMHAGDCVLQPPLIRHRVMESSAGAEVVEICTPAEHITMADRAMTLPNAELQPGRDFSGQKFVSHVAALGAWVPWRVPGFEVRDTGIGEASAGLAGVRVVRPQGRPPAISQVHANEFCFYFVLSGSVRMLVDGQAQQLESDDSITIPGGMAYTLAETSADLALLEVTLPADIRL
jgi:mannose-6-phosphate isomerase-like protein (cupin superfamily)